ncbi:hypothetical protein APSETT445_001415 [Aspergillus pseudonomiae]
MVYITLTYSLPNLFDGLVTICFARAMGTEKECFGLTMLESHETVFPIADMVPKSHIQNYIPQVEAVEIEPESINDAVTFVHNDQHSWCIAVTPSSLRTDGLPTIPFPKFVPNQLVF